MNKKASFWLYLLLIPIIVLTSFTGYFIADKINENRGTVSIEVNTSRYSASTMIVVNYTKESLAEGQDMMSAAGSSALILAENVAIIFSYSDDIQNLIPAGYELSVSPVNESNVFCITISGNDPELCANTANAVRAKTSEVFDMYYSDGEARPLGYEATAPQNYDTEIIEVDKPEVSYVLFIIIGFVVGSAFCVLFIILNEKRAKKIIISISQ